MFLLIYIFILIITRIPLSHHSHSHIDIIWIILNNRCSPPNPARCRRPARGWRPSRRSRRDPQSSTRSPGRWGCGRTGSTSGNCQGRVWRSRLCQPWHHRYSRDKSNSFWVLWWSGAGLLLPLRSLLSAVVLLAWLWSGLRSLWIPGWVYPHRGQVGRLPRPHSFQSAGWKWGSRGYRCVR